MDSENVVIFEDNQSVIAIAQSEGPSKNLKYTDVILQFIKKCVMKRKMTIKYMQTASNRRMC